MEHRVALPPFLTCNDEDCTDSHPSNDKGRFGPVDWSRSSYQPVYLSPTSLAFGNVQHASEEGRNLVGRSSVADRGGGRRGGRVEGHRICGFGGFCLVCARPMCARFEVLRKSSARRRWRRGSQPGGDVDAVGAVGRPPRSCAGRPRLVAVPLPSCSCAPSAAASQARSARGNVWQRASWHPGEASCVCTPPPPAQSPAHRRLTCRALSRPG